MSWAEKVTIPEAPELAPSNDALPVDEEALIERYLAHRNPDDFEEIVRQHHRWVYRVAFAICANRALAEDVVQESLLHLTAKSVRFENQRAGSFRAWFYVIVSNTAKSCLKKERRARMREQSALKKEPPSTPPEILNESAALQNSSALRDALFGLSTDIRLPIVLHFLEGLTQAEIGKLIGINQSQVSRRLTQGLELLRRNLKTSGISLSVATLPALLQNHPDFHASGKLGYRILGRVSEGLKASGRLRMTKPFSPAKVWAVVCSCALAGCAAVWAFSSSAADKTHASSTPNRAEEPLRPEASVQPEGASLLRRWDFGAAEQTHDLKVISGAWKHQEREGLNGSGCMVTVTDSFVAELPVHASGRTLLISFMTQSLASIQGGNAAFAILKPIDDSEVGLVGNLSRAKILTQPVWLDARSYIYPSNIEPFTHVSDQWNNGLRYSVLLARTDASDTIQLLVRGKTRLDNLEIWEIPPSQKPDLSEMFKAIQERLPNAGSKKVDLGIAGDSSLGNATIEFFVTKPRDRAGN